MGRKEVIQYFDDISGDALTESEVNVVSFGYKGTNYQIDLSESHLQEFEKALEPYISSARRVVAAPATNRRRTSSPKYAGVDPKKVRAWAVEQGLEVSSRGKLSVAIIEQYKAAHGA